MTTYLSFTKYIICFLNKYDRLGRKMSPRLHDTNRLFRSAIFIAVFIQTIFFCEVKLVHSHILCTNYLVKQK